MPKVGAIDVELGKRLRFFRELEQFQPGASGTRNRRRISAGAEI